MRLKYTQELIIAKVTMQPAWRWKSHLVCQHFSPTAISFKFTDEQIWAIKLQSKQYFVFEDLKRFSDEEISKLHVILICYRSFPEMP